MCLILLAWRMHPDYPLVVAANRDEFFARPTESAGFWKDHPAVLAGRDLEAGGTWMGVTRSGRFAALTNFRSPLHHQAGRPSRGQLVADFLTGNQQPERYLQETAEFGRTCNGYNLLVGDGQSLYCASNVSGEVHALEPGVYGLSNHLLDTPWPKVGAGRTALEHALGTLPGQQPLFDLLANDTIHPDHQLPATGVSLDWERLLSAAFIRSVDYGTRTSTVLCYREDGMISYEEQTWLPGAHRGERRRFRFRRESPNPAP